RHRDPPSLPTRRSSDLGNRHEGVVLAAQFGTLAVIETLLLGLEPDLVDPAGHRIGLYAETRHGEGVNDIRCRHQNAGHLVDGNRSEEHTSELQSRENLV